MGIGVARLSIIHACQDLDCLESSPHAAVHLYIDLSREGTLTRPKQVSDGQVSVSGSQRFVRNVLPIEGILVLVIHVPSRSPFAKGTRYSLLVFSAMERFRKDWLSDWRKKRNKNRAKLIPKSGSLNWSTLRQVG